MSERFKMYRRPGGGGVCEIVEIQSEVAGVVMAVTEHSGYGAELVELLNMGWATISEGVAPFVGMRYSVHRDPARGEWVVYGTKDNTLDDVGRFKSLARANEYARALNKEGVV